MQQQKHLLENKAINIKKTLQKLMIYLLIAVYTVISFLFVFFTILPTINNVGVLSFGANEITFISYGLLPFICIDLCIVKGYLWLLKRAIKRTLNIIARKDVADGE